MRIAPKPSLTVRPTQQQLQFYRLLQLTNIQLENDIREETSQNPALEIEEVRRCPRCGEILMEGSPCITCLPSKADDSERERISDEQIDILEDIYSLSAGSYEASTYESIPEDERPDSFATIIKSITLEDHLKHRLRLDCTDLSPEDILLAEVIIDYIDSDSTFSDDNESLEESIGIDNVKLAKRIENPGLIRASNEALAKELDVPVEQLSRVRRRIAEIDPIGSGLESPIEVLAVQAELAEDLPEDERKKLAIIIRNYLTDISKERYASVAKKVNLPTKRVKELIDYVKKNFHIYPRSRFEELEPNAEVDDPYVQPDVRIREVDGKLICELLDSGMPMLKLNKYYVESYNKLKANRNAFSSEERKHIKEYFERAAMYIQNLDARRQTILEITEEIIRRQEDFLRLGPLYLNKLTRKQIAEKIGVHPSTVSRALAFRYCWLPNNSIVPFSIFFNPSLSYIEMIKDILKQETHEKVFSDEEICAILNNNGHRLKRRVITKYRKKGKIPSSSRRKRILLREWKKKQGEILLQEDLPEEDQPDDEDEFEEDDEFINDDLDGNDENDDDLDDENEDLSTGRVG